ncbi:MAG TPA: helix-turn-helix domain-containing protein [Candidatus Hydrogenedentes bacterium]|nr:helix-turn-helix domain-containing protein [Candidatus Hydrogenedentota bacterium]HNT89492.1 helix-turn-helix domain-containing protein [Candidatus Hydrogenedentota bacterium]
MLNRNNPRRGETDWDRVRGMTDAEAERAARADVDAPPTTARELAAMKRVPDVRAIRKRLKLTQREFARRFHLTLAVVRDWEQRRSTPDQAARAFLRVIAYDAKTVEAALKTRNG